MGIVVLVCLILVSNFCSPSEPHTQRNLPCGLKRLLYQQSALRLRGGGIEDIPPGYLQRLESKPPGIFFQKDEFDIGNDGEDFEVSQQRVRQRELQKEQDIVEFIKQTGLNRGVARAILGNHAWDLERALNVHFGR